jgi:hypothetical protein
VTPPAQVASLNQATLEAMAQASPAPVALPNGTAATADAAAGAPAALPSQAPATVDPGTGTLVNSARAAPAPGPLAPPATPTLPNPSRPPSYIPPTLFDQLNEMPLGGSTALAEFAPDVPCSSCDTASSLIDTQESYPANPCMDSEAPVRYADGTVNLTFQDLSSNGFGVPWGQTRTWTNNATYAASTLNGWGMFDVQQPFLARYGASQIVLFLNGHDARYFQDNGDGTYSEHFSGKEGLKFDGAHFILSDHKGTRLFFSAPVDTNHNGLLLSINDPYGGATTFTYSGTPSQLQSVTRTDAASGITETYGYGYVSGFLASVTLSRSNTPGTIREVDYTYYGVNGINEPNNGNLGDLRTATIRDGSGNILDVSYYRYYVTSSPTGYMHGLKYALGPQSYARAAAAGFQPESSTDDQIKPYADYYFEYGSVTFMGTSLTPVTKERVQGVGCTACSGGQGEYNFTYRLNPNYSMTNEGPNAWYTCSTETLPDGNQNIVYTNGSGQVMLKVFVSGGQQWRWFYSYDTQGKVVFEAQPSAITGYDESQPDLLQYLGTNQGYNYIRPTAGLVQITDYYGGTSAGETTPGSVSGYLQDVKVEQGDVPDAQHPQIVLRSVQYYAHTPMTGRNQVYPIATTTNYRDTNGLMTEITNYSYDWFPNSAQMSHEIMKAPLIPSTQNGPGTYDQTETYFDIYGRPIWTKDPDLFLHYTAYDPGTGAVTRTITDVSTDPSHSGDYQNLPMGWSTPTGGGLHLLTQYMLDPLGRVTKQTDPAGTITYTVYVDPNHEVRTYPGWTGTTTTGPIVDTREDRTHALTAPDGTGWSYTETFTMSTPASVTSGQPDGTEPIANVQSLSRAFTSAGGQVLESDSYFAMPTNGYTTTPQLGTAGANYYATSYSYDKRGRRNKVLLPTGTINRTVYDGLSRVASTWVGTNDVTTTRANSQARLTGPESPTTAPCSPAAAWITRAPTATPTPPLCSTAP